MGVRLVRWNGWMCLGVWLVLSLWTEPAQAQRQEFDPEKARQECSNGVTIYCLALGMEAERAGDRDLALEYYRIACTSHPTPGHLRACTPLLHLSRQMERLQEEVRPLEKRCQDGNKETCFYLGKEYLKIGELNRGSDLLLPLCREGYPSPDPNDYGACYHMARGYERSQHYGRAQELFELDCNRNPGKARASCEALLRMAYVRKESEKVAWSQVQEFRWLEIALGVLAVMPLVGTWLWYRQKPWAWQCLRAGPVIAGISLVLWELSPKEENLPPADRIVSVLSFLAVVGLAAMAHQKLQERQDTSPPNPPEPPTPDSPV
ncbi:tetratricopeptide repeat protein [Nitrospina sp. 32_T5]|uniref:tetratricopeptide repeat protein n=1 Tax=unclassified Nitrospina TaxID=2638683 RepID=UPI003F9CED62